MHLTEHNLGCSLPNVDSEQSEAAGAPGLFHEPQTATLRFCSGDDALSYASKCLQRADRRLIRENRHVTERYIASELEICVECPSLFDAGEYHLIFSFIPSGWCPKREVERGLSVLGCFEYTRFGECHRRSCAADRNDNRMLVGYTKLVQGPESTLPSLVRLERAKERRDITWDILTPTGDMSFNVFGRIAKGESCVFEPLVPADFGGCVSGLVESGSEIVNSIGGNISDLAGQFLDEFDFVKLGSAVNIGLNNSGVWAALEESGTLNVHISKVSLCIRDPAFWAVERVICEANHVI
jgi:hypothetical protein